MRAVGRRRLRLGRVEVDSVTFAEALDAIAAMVKAGEGGASSLQTSITS